jgi:cyclopropane-fatty-acyl-phospholipid synthase
MSVVTVATRAVETIALPDPVIRLGVRALVGRTRRRLVAAPDGADRDFARAMAGFPIAQNTEDANRQHYELPPRFFELVLGPRRKYSSCFFATPDDMLARAEDRALDLTMEHAGLADGQRILELGCGWGSLSLTMAERFSNARITAVSNSHAQRRDIAARAAARGLANLAVVTADMNDFSPDHGYDRVVSVEMFEHMANWRPLLARIRGALAPEGRLFLHVFSHRARPYRFDLDDRDDWIAQHFFTGGIMPSHDLVRQFGDLFAVEQSWRWSGTHYERTALDWLANFDREADAVMVVMHEVYGAQARVWYRRWRLFFLATAGLFGYRDGQEWGVSHYRLRSAAE